MPVTSPVAGAAALFRKLPIDLVAVALACAIAGAGYRLGHVLAHKDDAANGIPALPPAPNPPAA